MQVTVHTSVVVLTANEYDRDRWRKERTITYSKVHRERGIHYLQTIQEGKYRDGRGTCKRSVEINEDKIKEAERARGKKLSEKL